MNRQFAFEDRSFKFIPGQAYEGGSDRWESRGLGTERGDPVDRFIGTEHRDIADLASGKELTTIVFNDRGDQLTFGEVVALAGDHFETYEEMRDLATTPAGRAILAWARWWAMDLHKQNVPEPKGDKAFVMERYYLLASRNFSHYSSGGTGFQTYSSLHSKAITSAVQAGEENSDKIWRIALTKEAFAVHFLTDLFSAGHVRVPRAEIHQWYSQNMPGDQLLSYMASFVFDYLNAHGKMPTRGRIFADKAREKIKNDIVQLGGAAIKTVTVGDIVAVALHDLEGLKLQVVSEKNPDGKVISGGFRWTAVGDGKLGKSSDGSTTKMMATAAVVTSLRDLERARGIGRKMAGSKMSAAQRSAEIRKVLGPTLFAAKAFVPREDPSGANAPFPGPGVTKSPLEWRWGKLGDTTYRIVDDAVKGRISGELFDRLNSVSNLDARKALEEFVRHLRKEGIHVLEKAVGRKAR